MGSTGRRPNAMAFLECGLQDAGYGLPLVRGMDGV